MVMAVWSRNSLSWEVLVDVRRDEEVQRSVVLSWMWVVVRVLVVMGHVCM